MADQISVGLIGYGMAGRTFHAPVIQSVPNLRLKKVVERHTNEARQRYPWVEVVPDATTLLQDEEIKLVVIATPNISHFDLARQSLQANKHVVVEKPFTTTSGQAQELMLS
jgi:predicted dehydrogenase